MKTKIIPFDLETAKKIQAGEIEGKIKCCENDGYAYDADIIKFDLITNKAQAKPNSNLYRTIVAIIDFDNHQDVRVFNTYGYGYNNNGDDTKLFIEVPDNKPQFKPFDKVLVRKNDDDCQYWQPKMYSFFHPAFKEHVTTDGMMYEVVLPYEGNEHLVGTIDKPKES